MNKLATSLPLRGWYFITALICAGLMGYAYYSQRQMFLDPCPLCIFQRVAFMWVGGWALIAAIHNPVATGRWIYTGLITLGSAVGGAIAARHVWLQGLPADEIPECGPGLSYMVDTLPMFEVLRTVLTGSGSCAEVQWQFMGLSMPAWTLIWFVSITMAALYITWAHQQGAKAT